MAVDSYFTLLMSLSNAANSDTTTSSFVRLENGEAHGLAAAATTTPAVPNYHHYVVTAAPLCASSSSQPLPLPPRMGPGPLPVTLEQYPREIQEQWTELWRQLQNDLGAFQRLDGLFYVLAFPIVYAVMLVMFWIFPSMSPAVIGATIVAEIAVVLAWYLCYSHCKNSRLRSMRAICRYHEQQWLRGNGYAVECQFRTVPNEGLSLYFIPLRHTLGGDNDWAAVLNAHDDSDTIDDTDTDQKRIVQRNGYVRIEVYNTKGLIGMWTPISLPFLSSLIPSLPLIKGYEALHADPDEVWRKFWTDKYEANEKLLRSYRLIQVTKWLFLLWFMVHVFWVQKYTIVVVLGYVCLVSLLFLSCFLMRVSPQQLSSRAENQASLMRSGFHTEFRAVREYTWIGSHDIHYLYLFRSANQAGV
jgi:hypothetical protein